MTGLPRQLRRSLTWLAALAPALAALSGCATSRVTFTEANVQSFVLAPLLMREGRSTPSPLGVTDHFGLEGYVYAYAVLSWEDKDRRSGRHRYHFKWFANGEPYGTASGYFGSRSAPVILWAWQPTIAMGVGTHAVELHIRDELVARKNFRVSEDAPGPGRLYEPVSGR